MSRPKRGIPTEIKVLKAQVRKLKAKLKEWEKEAWERGKMIEKIIRIYNNYFTSRDTLHDNYKTFAEEMDKVILPYDMQCTKKAIRVDKP